MLQLNNIQFSYPQGKALIDIHLKIKQGSHVALIGESGCGKSTLLNLIYGLLQEESGDITFDGNVLDGADFHLVPGHSMMKYVPQEFDLMPFTTVFENVGEHLSIQIDDRASRIIELLHIVDMSDFKDRKVKTLSGGQKQRVAIAKALAQQPKVLLLDEPFSNIDNFRKNDLRRSLFTYLKKENITCLIATHDKDDVLPFTHETIIMRYGRITDHRNTIDCYQKPLNKYGASLFNEVNVIPVGWFNNAKEIICYPEQLAVNEIGIEVIVKHSYFKGADYLIQVTCQDKTLLFNSPKKFKPGQKVKLALKSN
ncbi:ABC transporter ATP-binding protein [Nonlabens mediterrranea]|uniref:ABC transporter ATP-binding protein n=1 Tax=Nonlabens mediterrranea TaxID=1419947 RepID=A0ABS0A959_9FLAO|nr:ABC transporter ATP-binding protein [Nonlabens mediterrranea]